MEVSPLKRVLMRTMPELEGELKSVINAFDLGARPRRVLLDRLEAAQGREKRSCIFKGVKMFKRVMLLLLSLFVALVVFADELKPMGPLTKVASKTVCMVNEHAMGKDQIPVEVDGKTYYGCCDMCKKALAENAEKRAAVDPVTGKKVDKATAVIAAQEDGRVFYFESDETLAKHNAQFTK